MIDEAKSLPAFSRPSSQTLGMDKKEEQNMDNGTQASKKKWYDNKAIVIVLLFFFFPVGLFALWKSGNFSKVTKWSITGVFAFLMILASMSDDSETSTSTTTQSPSKPLTTEQLVARVVISTMGKKANWDGKPDTLIKIYLHKQVAGEDEGGYLVDIEYRANDNLTVGFTRTGILSDAQNLIEKLSKTPELSEIKIYMLRPYMNLVDKYGNEEAEQIGKMILRKAIADRINFKNMYPDAFRGILETDGQFWLHPAIDK